MSDILIQYDGNDITSSVIFADAAFEMQMNAQPGTGRFRVLDPDQDMTFITGREVRVRIDGVWMWGGYLKRKRYTYPFSADDTSDPEDYTKRVWELECVDYNILWDARYLRNESNYKGHIPDESGYAHDTMDGWAIWKMLRTFSDFPSGFGITGTRSDADTIDDVREVLAGTKPFFYKQQSTPLREQMDEFGRLSGASYYISADKRVHFHAYESVIKRWGFSDNPNYVPITTSPADFQDATYGFREVTGEEDSTEMVNDALIWGGSPLGSNGQILFARYQNEVDDLTSTSTTYIQHGSVVADSSIDLHGRWQMAEAHTEGGMYGNLDGVKARAHVIIAGPTGTSAKGETKGYSQPVWQFEFTWFGVHVPFLDGDRDHIIAGDIVRIELAVFGIARFAPCRTLRLTFPNLDPNGDPICQFNGEFSYSYTDSTTMWRVLKDANKAAGGLSPAPSVTTGDSSSTVAVYGAYFRQIPEPAPDGVTTDFTTANGIGYISGTLELFYNGISQRSGIDFTEVDGDAGTFSTSSAPVSTDEVEIKFRALAT